MQDASCAAIQAIIDHILPGIARNYTLQPDACSALLTRSVQNANEIVRQQNIFLHAQEGVDVDAGIFSTVTAAMIIDSTAYIANVGNSRTYLYHTSEGLKKITTDHSVVARLVEEGVLQPDDIYTHPQRKQIYRCLGESISIDVDMFSVQMRPGDTLLLCSPGLWNMVRDHKIAGIVSNTSHNPSQSAEMLI